MIQKIVKYTLKTLLKLDFQAKSCTFCQDIQRCQVGRRGCWVLHIAQHFRESCSNIRQSCNLTVGSYKRLEACRDCNCLLFLMRCKHPLGNVLILNLTWRKSTEHNGTYKDGVPYLWASFSLGLTTSTGETAMNQVWNCLLDKRLCCFSPPTSTWSSMCCQLVLPEPVLHTLPFTTVSL